MNEEQFAPGLMHQGAACWSFTNAQSIDFEWHESSHKVRKE